MSRKKASIVVPVRTADGFRDVIAAAIHGKWAVHRSLASPREWSITHVPSGLKIPEAHTELLTKAKAIEATRRIADEVPARWRPSESTGRVHPVTKTGKLIVAIIHEVLRGEP